MLKRFSFLAIFAGLLVLHAGHFQAFAQTAGSTSAVPRQIAAEVFDIDGNLFLNLSKTILFNKRTGRAIEIDSDTYEREKKNIGVSGRYKNYYFEHDEKNPYDGSWRYTYDFPGHKNFLAEDVKLAIRTREPHDWQGPMWDRFIAALSSDESARNVYIITARGQSPESIHEMLEVVKNYYFEEKGIVLSLPPPGNLYGVSQPRFRAAHEGLRAPQLKVKAFEEVLDLIESTPVAGGRRVVGHDGTGLAALQVVQFSDDTPSNFEALVQGLSGQVWRWPHTKIELLYTGPAHPGIPDPFVVLKFDGSIRALTPVEFNEPLRLRGPVRTNCLDYLEDSTGTVR